MLTSRREDFLCRCETTDNGSGFVVFTTRSNLETLCNNDVITMDGTFRVCPKFFHQLYTVHGCVNGHYNLYPFGSLLVVEQKYGYICAYYVEHGTSQLCSYEFLFRPTQRCHRF